MQSQIPNPPYIGLWTRLRGFEKAHLTAVAGKAGGGADALDSLDPASGRRR